MSDTPTPRSYPEILGDMIDTFLAEQKLSNLRAGSPLLSTFEAAASSDLRSSQDIFDLLNSASLDNATGLALTRIGQEENVPKRTEIPATGNVDITDTSFQKLASRVFQGKAAPIVGSFTLYVQDAALWPTSGQVYIGRGTSNYEGPLSYTSVANMTTHWQINLSQATTKSHDVGENVIVAQGGIRTIGKGTIVKTPQANVADAIEFRTLYNASIPDGETTVSGVIVIAEKPGVIGNIPAKSIKSFSTAPFTGAAVTNGLPFSNGRETESEDAYRERIRVARRTRAKGTPLAIKNSVDGITATDENKRVTSSQIVSRTGYPTTLYIDDGTGYEEKSAGSAVEILVDSALGGEQYFEAKQRPIAKAFLLSRNSSPFLLAEDAELVVKVGDVTYSHRFDGESFSSITSASAYEVVASINANPDLGFTARTADSGTRVALSAKSETNEDIEVISGITEAFRFPTGRAYTLQLYKNDLLLQKDGRSAIYQSNNYGSWDNISGPQTLQIAVDDGPAVTYTFTDADFINAKTGFTTVSNHTAAAWVKVFNRKVPGVSTREDSGRILLTSNAGVSSAGLVRVVGGSLVAVRMFDVGEATGRNRDYTMDRNTAQIRLETPLATGDRLSIGSSATRSFIESDAIGSVTTASTGLVFFSVDGDAQRIPLGVSSSTQLKISIASTHDWGNRIKIEALSGLPFVNVVEGDWVAIYDSAIPATVLKGIFRICEVNRDSAGVLGSVIYVERPSALTARKGHRVVALPAVGGAISRAMAIGGFTRNMPDETFTTVEGATDSCEIFSPSTGLISAAPNMTVPRAHHTATVLNSGKVLVTGGISKNGEYLASTEIYDPATNTWVGGPALTEAVAYHEAVKLASGNVVFIGGTSRSGSTNVYSTVLSQYDAVAGTITAFAGTQLAVGRARHRCVLLNDGRILIAGGRGDPGRLDSCELFTPSGPSIATTTSMNAKREDFGLSIYGGSPIAVGNHDTTVNQTTWETFNTGTSTWTVGQISSLRPVHFDSKQLVQDSDGNIYAMHAWYWSNGVRVPAIYKYNGTWTELVGHTLNKDSHTWYGKQWACVATADLSTKSQLIGFGGYNPRTASLVAQHEWYNATGNAWVESLGNGTAELTVTLSSPPGVAAARSSQVLQKVSLNAGTYTTANLRDSLNQTLIGATAATHKTNKLRISTNSFGLDGDISAIAGNVTGLNAYKIETQDAIQNLVGHMASLESGTRETGTPSFQPCEVVGVSTPMDSDSVHGFVLNIPSLGGGEQLVGLRNRWSGTPENFHTRFGSSLNTRLKLSYILNGSSKDSAKADIRNAVPNSEPMAFDRFYAAAPFAIGPEDNLTVQVDSDLNKRYSINMWRKLKPTTNTYGFQNAFLDADSANATIASNFGLTYPFGDFTVYMKARALAFPSDSSRRVLFRYFKPGPDGEHARVRFSNPTAALSPLKVVVDNLDAKSNISIQLPGGAARNLSLRSTTRLGSACVSSIEDGFGTVVFYLGGSVALASRSVANTTMALTVTLPPAVDTFGIQAGDSIYLQSTNSNFATGRYTVSAVAAPSGGAQVVTVTDASGTFVGSAANIGTISFDTQGEAKFAGSATTPGDFFRLNSLTSLPAAYENNTFYIFGVGDQYITVTSGDGSVTTNGAGRIDPINDVSYVSVFAPSPTTVTSIASSLNALAATQNSACPITMTVTGSGSGTVYRSTADDSSMHAWYELSDGINWIAEVTNPPDVVSNYSFTFKKPINGNLSTNCDWQNEDIRIVPTTAQNVVRWLNTPTITGLSASCIVQTSDCGSRVQLASKLPGSKGAVQVQGGLANRVAANIRGETKLVTGGAQAVSTIPRSLSDGLTAGMWCSIDNATAGTKSGVITSGTVLGSWNTDGLITLASGSTYAENAAPSNVHVKFEKQGDFVAISALGLDAQSFPVVSAVSSSVTDKIIATVKIPTGMTSTGWQVGDVVDLDFQPLCKIIRAERVAGPNQWYFDLAYVDGLTGTGVVPGDSMFLVGGTSLFPQGIYNAVAVVPQSNGTDRVQCTQTSGTILSSAVAEYEVGLMSIDNSDFGSQGKITSIGLYNSGSKTMPITIEGPGIDLSKNFPGAISKDVDWSTLKEGDWIRIGTVATPMAAWANYQVPATNQGIYRIVRYKAPAYNLGVPGTIWIENPAVVEGTFEARIASYDYNWVMPGDKLIVNTDKWGAENRGTWTVEKVGVPSADSNEQFTTTNTLKVSLATRTPRAMGNVGALGDQAVLIQIEEAKPGRAIKRISGICPNQDDASYVDVRWDTSNQSQQISGASGSIVTALDKFLFPVDLAAGVDGYNYNTGLIGEANRVVYGDASDISTYPGFAAAGAQININGPLVRRIKIALQIRVRTGASLSDVGNRVRSAVATIVNQVGVGVPVALSDIVSAASKVGGVVAVTVLSPTYTTESDLLPVQPYEKPLIVNLSQDISITFAGE